MVVLRCRSSGTAPELDYVGALNRQLPDDIRVLSWRPAPPAFSARFKYAGRRVVYLYSLCAYADALAGFVLVYFDSATWRQYKYHFWNDGLDVAAMRDAASRLVGTHDFRNLCKMDVDAVCNFVRRIEAFTVEPETEEPLQQPGGCQQSHQGRLWAFNVTGSAFLWHQVRCMAALLLLVGRRLEAPSVMDALLDVAALPGKPAYEMAPEEPLLLFACGYDHGDGPGQLPALSGATPPRSAALVVEHLRAQTRLHAVRSQMFGHALQVALQLQARPTEQQTSPSAPIAPARHVPLLQRTREATFEEQVARRAPGKIKWLRQAVGAEADEPMAD
jgi:tRNA pseudouridine38/39 synthase